MQEEWKPIRGLENLYDVSNFGRVRSRDMTQIRSNGKVECTFHIRGRILKPVYSGKDAKNGGGYATVKLNGKNYAVHRIVAEAFIENPNGYEQVNHIDGNKHNNHASNLEWCSPSQNIYHSLTHDMRRTGERMPTHKLSLTQVEEIRRRYKKGSSINGAKPLAREYGVADTTIRKIATGEKWRWD